MTVSSDRPPRRGLSTSVRRFGEKAAEPPRATYGRASRRSTAAAAAGGVDGPTEPAAGGRPQLAQAGGKDPGKLSDALEAARKFARDKVGT